ncbi:MAG: flap endonuclease-1 [Candidatus Methanomethylicota archaeon]|uniref:Flap endonuclease 1 n=1 Tax=Thermoproteota archaeon TaxID=2056631 RepID=A0A497F3K6_9CREN|nr:MAG: flap endonuclease-1 [Candidatus Verstraetearchaeota archaeon]
MSVNIGSLLSRRRISLRQLAGRTIAIDALNALYQFLSIIRLPTGFPLTDHEGRVTSHLVGLFYRTIGFLEKGILPIYVFDGSPPKFKMREVYERRRVREKFTLEWIEALREGDIAKAFKKSVMTARVTSEIINESKYLLSLMGVPWVQAPSEGEAQAAYMTVKGDVYASASQDYDSILFGSKVLIRNLAIESKQFYPKKGIFKKLQPEIIILDEVLSELKISRQQLIDIAILIGTDYNEGIKGIGPKKALKLIRIYGSAEKVIKALNVQVDFDIEAIRNFFLNPPVTNQYSITVNEPKIGEIKTYLMSRQFNAQRVEKALERLLVAYEKIKTRCFQQELLRWFK